LCHGSGASISAKLSVISLSRDPGTSFSHA
jgi:hypothetical protein